jgi:hypothetical protein
VIRKAALKDRLAKARKAFDDEAKSRDKALTKAVCIHNFFAASKLLT